jgi:pyrroloquinoline quinone (PQQ) biosynthesis protein C
MNTEEFRKLLKQLPQTHPFYQKAHPFWRVCFKGKLPKEAICAWALDTHPFVRDFPRAYMRVAAKTDSTEALTYLGETIYEETGCGEVSESHANLFSTFMGGLGMSEQDLLPEPPSKGGRAAWAYVGEMAKSGTFLEGLACVGLGVERPLPEFYAMLAKSFQARYAVPESSVRYFSLHTSADVKHSMTALKIILREANTEELQQRVVQVITGLWDIQLQHLDELLEHYGARA